MSFFENDEIILDIWGDFACFTNPESKVDRVTFDCITPSAARGILCAIYSKPIEFYYQITKIEIMNPIKKINIRKNEFKEKTNAKSLEPCYNITEKGNKGLTQRNNVYLQDVYYRIHAKIIKQPSFSGTLKQLYEQVERRIKQGKCFYQPCLGIRECMCFYSLPDYEKQPLNLNLNLGFMVYDVFDIRNNIPLDTEKNVNTFCPSYFNANVVNGVIEVPDYMNDLVLKL